MIVDKEKIKHAPEQKKDIKGVKSNDEHPYVVELYDIWGTTSKRVLRLPAKRFIEKGNVFLYNEKLNFKVEFPEDNEEYKKYKTDEVKNMLKKKDTELKLLLKKKDFDLSRKKDIEEDIRVLNGWEKSLALQGRGSYMMFDDDANGGKPLFMFDRKGNFKLPVFKNIDISLMHVPNEANIIEGSDLLKENFEKNGADNQVKMVNIVLAILMVIVILGFGYIAYKTTGNNQAISEVLAQAISGLDTVADKFAESTEQLSNMTISVTENIPKIETPTPNVKPIN